MHEIYTWTAFAFPFNATGQPAVSVPMGFNRAGLPLGLQIVGRPMTKLESSRWLLNMKKRVRGKTIAGYEMTRIDPAILGLCALALALIFGASGVMKLRDIEMFEGSLANYQLAPRWMEKPLAYPCLWWNA